MQRHFDEELEQLKQKLLRMSSLVEQIIGSSIKALIDRDSKLAEQVVALDNNIDMFEIEVDELSLKLLALYQPQAGDLRFITSTMKINNDLERIGDLAVNIAQRAMDLNKVPPVKSNMDIVQMANSAQGMLKDSLNAFVNKDSKLAADVCKRDDVVDEFNRQIFRKVLTDKPKNQPEAERAIDLILVAKNLERIADHSTNICEDVIYMVEGKVIKHHIADEPQ
ncbi:MAG: phosphate transport system regulatory protein PhoU [Omnitrophica WOR_2 bacterium GWA2_47_8]|nr:MAG: phosphate transport system regulatory protein PhoU [Omnitrophica WOR_2 bacterium GWA2_47_8]